MPPGAVCNTGQDPCFFCVSVGLWLFLMSHDRHNKRQKRLKVMEDTAKESGVTLSALGFKC